MLKGTKTCNKATLWGAMLIATIATSCQSNVAKITGRFIGGDSTVVYLEEITNDKASIIDSAVLNTAGEFAFKVATKDQHHKLYNIVYDWSTIPLFAAAGENVEINSVGNVANNYTVEGSEESELVRNFYQEFTKGIATLDKIAMEYANEDTTEERRQVLTKEYSAEHNRIKRAQLEFIITNKANLAAVYALYQRLPNDSYLFNGKSDAIYYRTVAEAIEENYPESPYLKRIESDLAEVDAYNALTANIVERGYPDLELKDIYGKTQKLSDLEGKVVLLDFWSAQIGSSNNNNAELREIYDDLKDQGFEVYQVAIDSRKSVWINAVNEQKLPWISVSDLKGSNSTALSLYNITALPSNFLISKGGEIISRDLYGDSLRSRVKSELAK